MSEPPTPPTPQEEITELNINLSGLDEDSIDPAILKIIQNLQSKVAVLEKDKSDVLVKADTDEKNRILDQIVKKGFKREEFENEPLSSLKSAMKLLANSPDIDDQTQNTMKSTETPKNRDQSFGWRDPVKKEWVSGQKSDK